MSTENLLLDGRFFPEDRQDVFGNVLRLQVFWIRGVDTDPLFHSFDQNGAVFGPDNPGLESDRFLADFFDFRDDVNRVQVTAGFQIGTARFHETELKLP